MIQKKWGLGLALLSLTAALALAQPASKADPNRTPEEMQKLFDRAEKKDPAAVDRLAQLFEMSTAKGELQQIALVLVRAGVKDNRYWEYLAEKAREALALEIPGVPVFDASGRVIPRVTNPELVAWAARRGIPIQKAIEDSLYHVPGDILLIGLAKDPRSSSILLRALESRNHAIVAMASAGLARLRDGRAIDPIIHAAKRFPAEAAELVARPLVVFPDERAQKAAEELIRDKARLRLLREAAQKDPEAVF